MFLLECQMHTRTASSTDLPIIATFPFLKLEDAISRRNLEACQKRSYFNSTKDLTIVVTFQTKVIILPSWHIWLELSKYHSTLFPIIIILLKCEQ